MNSTKRYFAAVLLTLVFPLLAQAQSTVNYDWLTQGEVSGRLQLAMYASGERSAHFEFNDRGRGPALDERYRPGANGLLEHFETRGKDYMSAPVAERFTYNAGTARWQSTLETGSAERPFEAFYLANDGSPEQTAALHHALGIEPFTAAVEVPSGKASK